MAMHQVWPSPSTTASSQSRFGFFEQQQPSPRAALPPQCTQIARPGMPQFDSSSLVLGLRRDPCSRIMCSNAEGLLNGAEMQSLDRHGHRDSSQQDGEAQEEMDTVRSKTKPQSKEENSLNSALRRYLFVTPDGDSKRSKWVDRRSALLVVQNSTDVEAALLRVGDKMESSDMNLLLRRFAHHGRWDDACQLFEWMEKEKRVTGATYSTYIVMLGKAGRVSAALRAFSSLSKEYRLNPFICNSILSALVNNWKIANSFRLFRKLKAEGFKPDAVTYSTVLSGCLKIHDGFEKAQEIVEEMREKGMKPDTYAYGSLLRVYCANGHEQLAKAVVEEMRAEGVTLTQFHYSYLLNLYGRINKPSEAENIFRALKEGGVQPNDIIYRSMLRVYCKNGCLDQAKKILKEAQEAGVAADMVMYSALIDAYVSAGKVYEAHEILVEMRKKNIRPGGNAFSLLIQGYGNLGDIDMINKLAAECGDRLKGKQDVRVYNSLLKVYSQLKHDQGITGVLERMDREGILPDKGSFNILINHLCMREMFRLAIRTFNDMKTRKLQPNVGTYSRLISGLTKPLLSIPEQSDVSKILSKKRDVDLLAAAYGIFKEMQSRKVYCSQEALEQFVRANAIAKNWPLAVEALGCFQEAGYTADESLLEFLLIRASNDCHYGAMKEILSEVKLRGFSLSSSTLEKARETFSQLDHVKDVLERP